jgi:hypothetical protein
MVIFGASQFDSALYHYEIWAWAAVYGALLAVLHLRGRRIDLMQETVRDKDATIISLQNMIDIISKPTVLPKPRSNGEGYRPPHP